MNDDSRSPGRLPAGSRFRRLSAVLALTIVGLAAGIAGDGSGAVRAAEMPRAELVIVTAAGQRRFDVEIARTPAQRARGLMYRTELATDAGMLFVFDEVGEVAMWMRNTLIPLDMLFIARDGRIGHIAARTTPLSEKTIASRGPVRSVLELAGGSAERFGIEVGNTVILQSSTK